MHAHQNIFQRRDVINDRSGCIARQSLPRTTSVPRLVKELDRSRHASRWSTHAPGAPSDIGAIRPGLLDTPSTDHTLAFVLALFGLGSGISKILRASMHSSTARRWGRAVSRATPVVAGFLAAYSAIASGGVTTDLWFVVVAAVFILAAVAFILFKLRT